MKTIILLILIASPAVAQIGLKDAICIQQVVAGMRVSCRSDYVDSIQVSKTFPPGPSQWQSLLPPVPDGYRYKITFMATTRVLGRLVVKDAITGEQLFELYFREGSLALGYWMEPGALWRAQSGDAYSIPVVFSYEVYRDD